MNRLLSASYNTDIPRYFPGYLVHSIKTGKADPEQIKYNGNVPEGAPFSLNARMSMLNRPGVVYWTKDIKNLIPYMSGEKPISIAGKEGKYDLLDYAPPIIQHTMNNYGRDIEQHMRSFGDRMESIKEAAGLVKDKFGGGTGIVIRPDPIITTTRDGASLYTLGWWDRTLPYIIENVAPYTDHIKFSFLDRKPQNSRWMDINQFTGGDRAFQQHIADTILDSCQDYGIHDVRTCAEKVRGKGLTHGGCVDADLFKTEYGLDIPKLFREHYGSRAECACDASDDIGRQYTCPAKCNYCYANPSPNEDTFGFVANVTEGEPSTGQQTLDSYTKHPDIDKRIAQFQNKHKQYDWV